MREVKIKKKFGGYSEPWQWYRLDKAIQMMQDLSFNLLTLKVFPPSEILNKVFKEGHCDEGMGYETVWKPFEIDQDEYEELMEAIVTDPKLDITLDEELNEIKDYKLWEKAAFVKYNPRTSKYIFF